MNADRDGLAAVLTDRGLRLDPMTEAHREPLRAACAEDPAIWPIYFTSFLGADFDPAFANAMADPNRTMLAVMLDGTLIGMSGFLNISARNNTLEIGNTYVVPAARGTGANRRMKDLMLDHAFACGFERVEFKVDVRNARSQAAMAKLGAVREGVLRRHLVTWTGHVRDSAIYSVLRSEWARED
jgi:RimJ/RimL family protein N-acetyltransferase